MLPPYNAPASIVFLSLQGNCYLLEFVISAAQDMNELVPVICLIVGAWIHMVACQVARVDLY